MIQFQSKDSWESVYNGYGVTEIKDDGSVYVKPSAAEADNVTHACLAVSKYAPTTKKYELGTTMTTLSQTRAKPSPKAWEVAWLLWDVAPDQPGTPNSSFKFYDFILKPNGWEIGKQDPAYTGGQRFLYTGENLKLEFGKKYDIKVIADHSNPAFNKFSVYVNGELIKEFEDHERPIPVGKVGAYCEDAECLFEHTWVSEPIEHTKGMVLADESGK